MFGAGRLIYGSNWPVSERIAPYATVFKVVHDYFTSKGQQAPTSISGKTPKPHIDGVRKFR